MCRLDGSDLDVLKARDLPHSHIHMDLTCSANKGLCLEIMLAQQVDIDSYDCPVLEMILPGAGGKLLGDRKERKQQ